MSRERRQFEAIFTPHLDAAYNLARWMLRHEQDAQDAVQEAYLRAWKGFDAFQGDSGMRAWLLAIVRNVCLTQLGRQRMTTSLPEQFDVLQSGELRPDEALERSSEAALVRREINALESEYRDVIVLRELESLSYKEIAQVLQIPIGTVMSRLSRARALLEERLKRAIPAGEVP